MATRTARTIWKGALQTGVGTVELESSKQGAFDMSFPRRVAAAAGGSTSPEELLAAAHSACYSMALTGALSAFGATVNQLEVSADVTLGPDPADGQFKLTGILLTVLADAAGIEPDEFTALAVEAKNNCPLSKALTGVDIALVASLIDA